MIALETAAGVTVFSKARLVGPEDRETAWAEPLVTSNPLYAWVLGKLVGTGFPNENGHIFDADEVRQTASSLVHAPLNMLHRPHQILGSFVGAELVYPTAKAALGQDDGPYLESLAAMWRYYFQEEYETLKVFHDAGMLAQSMECIPRSVTCMEGGCGKEFAYRGRTHASYCEHINHGHAPPRKLNLPHFSAGAIVVPPQRPAWGQAKVSELLAATVEAPATVADAATALYDQVVAEFPGLDAPEWERVMVALMGMAPPVRTAASFVVAKPEKDQLIGPDMKLSAMVALYPSPLVAAQLAIPGGEDPDELHITLGFLGPDAVLRLDREAVEAALAPLAAVSPPLDGAVSGVGRFVGGYPAGQEPWPLIALVDIPALPEFRQRVLAVLGAAGVDVYRNHGFTPHMTLAYVEPPDEVGAAQVLARGLEPTPLHFDALVLEWGDQRIEFSLSAGDEPDGGDDYAAAAIADVVAQAREAASAIAVWRPEVGRSFTKAQRDDMAQKGWALPDGSFPIETKEDLRNAIRLRGKGGSADGRIKAHLVKRAKALGAAELLPEGWA